jgi:hypothetical protein
MALFSLNINHKTPIIIITSIMWDINFRSTFKRIDSHMDSGSYSSLKFDSQVILIKNIFSCLFLIGFFFENKGEKFTEKKNKEIVEKKEGDLIIIKEEEKRTLSDNLIQSISKLHRLDDTKLKIMFWIKIILIIFIIYLIEELYFIIANNHILDRLVCSIRNVGILLSLLIFTPLIMKKSWFLYRHQLIPIIIIFIISAIVIIYNVLTVERFEKIYGAHILIYLFSFMLTGIEIMLIKYLVDKECINIYLILGIKGIIGAIIFVVINIISSREDFFDFWDDILNFELEGLFIDFSTFQKILYIFSLLIVQYLKIYIIFLFTEYHLLSVLTITDLIFFPFYCIERFAIQDFGISIYTSFILNVSLGIINLFMMLIFNEILECNFWGINKNLEKHINERQKKDYLLEFQNSNSFPKDANSDEDGRSSDDAPFDE